MDLHKEAKLLLRSVESFWPDDVIGTERLKTKRLIELLEEFALRYPKKSHDPQIRILRLRAKILKRKLQGSSVRIE